MRIRVLLTAVLAAGIVAAIGCGVWGQTDVAEFTYAPDNPWPMQDVIFEDISDPCCTTIIARSWTFQDANPPAGNLPVMTVQFLSEGPHTATLSLTTREGYVDTVSRTIMVGNPAVNDPPLAYDATATTTAGMPVDITLRGMDPEGAPLTFFIDTQPSAGFLDTANIPLVTYFPPTAGWPGGVVKFEFHCFDGLLASNIAAGYVGVDDNPPTAFDNLVSVPQGAPSSITLQGFDPDSDPIEYIIDTMPLHGQLTGTAPNLTYTSQPNYVGQDAFTFHVTDHVLDSNAATITIAVTGSGNNPPIAFGDEVTTLMNTPVLISPAGHRPGRRPVDLRNNSAAN
jgi:hypothetical protein